MRSGEMVKRLSNRLILGLLILGLCGGSERAEARSFGDFLKALGNSIAHPHTQKRPVPRTTKRKDESKASPSPSGSPTTTPGAASVAPPNQQNVRAAVAAAPSKSGKRDLPYGIPVPGKQGFVTSPFAPDEGYVDVRSFPPGTEVKDPYTGKNFLTP